MPQIDITDPADARLADYTGLTDVALRSIREPAEGLYMAESIAVIRRAIEAGHRPRSFLMAPKWLPDMDDVLRASHAGVHGEVPVFTADDAVLRRITGFTLHRGALAAMHRPALPSVPDVLADARLVVVCEDIVDHTNVGAIFRSVAGMGADAVLVTPRCADPLYRRSVRVSMGSVLQVPWTRLPEWPLGADVFREAGFTVAAMALGPDAVALGDFAAQRPDRVALVLGTEGDGLSRAALDSADVRVQIPMQGGIDSLNVAAAAAVAIWEIGRAHV